MSAIIDVVIAPLLYDVMGSAYAILLIGVIGIAVCIKLSTSSADIGAVDNMSEGE